MSSVLVSPLEEDTDVRLVSLVFVARFRKRGPFPLTSILNLQIRIVLPTAKGQQSMQLRLLARSQKQNTTGENCCSFTWTLTWRLTLMRTIS